MLNPDINSCEKYRFLLIIGLILTIINGNLWAQSLDIPSNRWGISFGNSKNFTGLRLNYRDHYVEKILGVNLTLWSAYNNDEAQVKGISFGVMPQAGYLHGLQLGIGGILDGHGQGFHTIGTGL